MMLPSEIPVSRHPHRSVLSAAEVEDGLLVALGSEVTAQRDRLPVLLRRIVRLHRLLKNSHQEVVKLRRALERSEHMQGRDLLTGLLERRGLEQPLGRLLSLRDGSPHTLALLFIDLDGFKAINDRLGHAAGDQLLCVVAARLAAAMRRDDLVCRHGGDEFVCLLPDLDSEERARSLATQVLQSITQPCALGGHRVAVNASIGIAMYPRHGDSLPSLLRSADVAMYDAKTRRCGVAMARTDAGPG
jgi:diguanylate cyclase (GGDEF)-like protein